MPLGKTDSTIIEYAPGYGPEGPRDYPADKPYIKPAVLVRRDQPVSVYPVQPLVVDTGQQGQLQVTPMQLLIGGLLLYLLLKH